MAQTIRPQSFDRFASPAFRRSPAHSEWDPAVLKVLVALLVGHRVIVETEAHTGHAVEATVVGWKDSTLHSNYPHVTLKSVHGHLTNYRVSKIGVIMDLDDSNARWEASNQLHDLTGNALKALRAYLGGDWVVVDGLTQVWKTQISTDGSVTVRATSPKKGVSSAVWYVDANTGEVEGGASATRLLSTGVMTIR